ncbi:hypothetical protein N0V93_007905 [Gnomoniopsis smithogilvyi]|uniref:Stress response protein rds1p n=1 Tax=Gnomoniopsis smithogilvyi TaxID=1191159 RepID=A0A9W9CTE1_9PEZI|nr:hypothetical protein N0V93_007905 [Gnomoniopsis smithogilvyi]
MRSSSSLMGLMAASSLAAPLEKRANYDAPPGGDVTILNYALTLEYLERKFYQEGVANYTADDFQVAGCSETFYENLKEILYDEETHVSFLSGALGSSAVHEATYSFPATDAKSFLGLASVLEGVGVSAYLGAAGAIASKAYLTAAGSILTVESRHSSYIRAELGESPFPKPFDTPLDFNTVFSLAAQFITGFAPGDPALPFTAFPSLTVVEATSGPCKAGSSALTFTGAFTNAKGKGLVADANTPVYAVLYSGLDTYYVEASVSGSDYVIAAIPGADYGTAGTLPPSGQVYIVLSTADGNATKVADENTISGVGVIEVEA